MENGRWKMEEDRGRSPVTKRPRARSCRFSIGRPGHLPFASGGLAIWPFCIGRVGSFAIFNFPFSIFHFPFPLPRLRQLRFVFGKKARALDAASFEGQGFDKLRAIAFEIVE